MCKWTELLDRGGRGALMVAACVMLVCTFILHFRSTETVLAERNPMTEPLTLSASEAQDEKQHDVRPSDERKQLQAEMAALGAQSERLRAQITQLQQQVTALQLAQPGEPSVQRDESSASQGVRVRAQEAQLAASGTDQQNEFARLEEQFYAESFDPQWATIMQAGLQDVEARLSEQTQGDTYIEYQECRSATCRVEFVHAANAPALLPALIASPNNRGIVLQSVVESGVEKTIALYQRY